MLVQMRKSAWAKAKNCASKIQLEVNRRDYAAIMRCSHDICGKIAVEDMQQKMTTCELAKG
jgi:hypothetical protein